MRSTNLLIASVGGQGGLTLSRVIAIAAVLEGYNVRTGETLGMSQRFGSVISYIRVGSGVNSPIFGQGEADYILGLELTETLRNITYLKPDGIVIVADELKPPVSSSLGISKRLSRAEIIKELSRYARKLIVVPAKELAIKAGSVRALNMVILGVFNEVSKLLNSENVVKAIYTLLPGRKGEVSITAYNLGRSYASSLRAAWR